MLNIIQIIRLPIGNFERVVDREKFLDSDGIMRERMIGTLPALAESMEWAKRINPGARGYGGTEPPSAVKFLICVNGGTKDDVAEIEGYVKSLDFDWMFLQQDVVESEARCIEIMAAECVHEFTALVPGHTLVRENKWFEKLQQVYYKDRTCGMVGTDSDLDDNSSNPYRLSHRNHPSGPLVLLRKTLLSEIKWAEMPADCHVPTEISKQIAGFGANVWVAPSVRFSEIEWESPQQEKSATTTLSALPSSMTPD